MLCCFQVEPSELAFRQRSCRELGLLNTLGNLIVSPFADGGYDVATATSTSAETSSVVKAIRLTGQCIIAACTGCSQNELLTAQLWLREFVRLSIANRELQVQTCNARLLFVEFEFDMFPVSGCGSVDVTT